MTQTSVTLVLVVVTALAFDFTNGFHDTANAMATTIATKALRPKTAVALSGVLNLIGKQSPDIAQGVDRKDERRQGAGDQGLMFGYATNETEVLMPAPITLAHRLVKRQAQVRKAGKLPWLRPDAKSQVTLRYEDARPVGLEAVVLSTQHSPEVSTKMLREAVMEEILKPILPAKWVDKRTRYHINPTGRFVVGGPVGDCGLVGADLA